jgi:hypothetical protein
MADIGTPRSGAETSISITIDGVPVFVQEQVTRVTEKQEVTQMEHAPIGTMNVKIGQDNRGWSGDIEYSPSNTLVAGILDAVEASNRLGLPSVCTLTVSRTYNDLSSEKYLYTNVVFAQTGGNRQRGQFDTISTSWRSGDQRVAM